MKVSIYGRAEVLDEGQFYGQLPRLRVYDRDGKCIGDFTVSRKQFAKFKNYAKKDLLFFVLDLDAMRILQIQSAYFTHLAPELKRVLIEVNREYGYRFWFHFDKSLRSVIGDVRVWEIPFSSSKNTEPDMSLVFRYREDGRHALLVYLKISVFWEDLQELPIFLGRFVHRAKPGDVESHREKLRNFFRRFFAYLIAAQDKNICAKLLKFAREKPIEEILQNDKERLARVFSIFQRAARMHPLTFNREKFARATYADVISILEDLYSRYVPIAGRRYLEIDRAILRLSELLSKPLLVLLNVWGEVEKIRKQGRAARRRRTSKANAQATSSS